MSSKVTVTVLAENTVAQRGLLAEHGLAFWVETGGHRLLFDTGQGLVLAHNARALGIDLRTADAVVLSHGHYDHTGSLVEVLAGLGPGARVYVHPQALRARYHRGASGVRSVGMAPPAVEALRGLGPRCQPVVAPTEVLPGVMLSGEVPRRHPEEASDEGFRLDAAGLEPDPITDDRALALRTPSGAVVLLGCAHAGVINTLEHITGLAEGQRLHAVLGGMHLRSASRERVTWTVAALQRFSPDALCPMHCTGMAATMALWTAFPDRCVPGTVGATWTF